MVPGRALHRLAKLLLPAHVCDQIVDAQLADFQHEWVSAPNALARALVLARGYLAFAVVLVSCMFGMRGVAPDERRALRRMFAIAVVATILSLAAVLIYAVSYRGLARMPLRASPALLVLWRRERLLMLAELVNQSLPFAVAFGLMSGIAVGLHRHITESSRRFVVMLIAASCVVVFATINWMLPSGIQAFQHAIGGRFSGPPVTTLAELSQRVAIVEHTRTSGPGTIRSAQVQYHLRWSWPFASVALGLFALSLNHLGRAVRVMFGLAGCAGYSYLLRTSAFNLVWDSHLPPIFLAWLPNLIFVVVSLIIMTISRQGGAKVVWDH